MYYYFSSNYPAVIKINGIYYGTVFDTVKSISVEPNSIPFIEICPLVPNISTVNVLLDDKFICSPPENVCVTDMKGGYLIKFIKHVKSDQFKILSQKKFDFAVITVFNENGLKLSIETPDDFFAQNYNFEATCTTIDAFTINGVSMVCVHLDGDKKILSIYSVNSTVTKLFEREVFSFSTDNQLITTEKLYDIAKHELKICWDFDGTCFKEQSRTISCSDKFSIDRLNEKLVPYAFLEELYVGGNLECYLADNVLKNVNMVKDYFGQFIGVMPPPSFRSPFEIGLIYQKTANTYYVEYFTFSLSNRKITNFDKA